MKLLIWTLSQFFYFKHRSVWFWIAFEGDFMSTKLVFAELKISFLWLLAERFPAKFLSFDLYFLSTLLIYLRAESMLNLNSLEEGECEVSKSINFSSKSLGLRVISFRLRLWNILDKFLFLNFYWFFIIENQQQKK